MRAEGPSKGRGKEAKGTEKGGGEKGKGGVVTAEEERAKADETKRVGWIPTLPKSLVAANISGSTRKEEREEKAKESNNKEDSRRTDQRQAASRAQSKCRSMGVPRFEQEPQCYTKGYARQKCDR